MIVTVLHGARLDDDAVFCEILEIKLCRAVAPETEAQARNDNHYSLAVPLLEFFSAGTVETSPRISWIFRSIS